MAKDWQIDGAVADAPFSLKLHRGEGMVLLAMDWKTATPPPDFVGFAIEYRYPDGDRFYPVKNRIAFPGRSQPLVPGKPAEQYPSPAAPFQTFRWVHFPRVDSSTKGLFAYRVTPMFMNSEAVLAAGIAQEAAIELNAETMPGQLNVTFTRGYVSSQAFVDKFGGQAAFAGLIPANADDGNDFTPTGANAAAAYAWMGFEARASILQLLDDAIADAAEVRVVAFELNLPELIDRFARIGPKLRIIIDDSSNLKTKDGKTSGKDKGAPDAAESKAAATLAAAGADVSRQHMGALQHNKMIIVDGPTVKKVVFGSTNLSWRGFFVQANNAVIVTGKDIVRQQRDAFDSYWGAKPAEFAKSAAADWRPLQLAGLDAQVTMSPHNAAHSTQKGIADAMDAATSSIFYSLAFLNLIAGDVKNAVTRATERADLFVYGISDQPTKLELMQPGSTNPVPVSAASLGAGLPEPFRSEATGGAGVKMHHKFVVIDFNLPTARVYTGSYNFSNPADRSNGENLLVINSERIATAYMVEALRIFDSYQFRVSSKKAKADGKKRKELALPPTTPADKPWWDKFYTDPIKVRDRKLFA
ncbi:MAG: phospholipase D-like domain-containing protein [Pseudomonadota bacterium]